MKIIVLGSGVIGVTSAYYLTLAGHEVTVLDRQSGPALETSFANAGEISPGGASPWAAPGVPLKAIKWLTMRDGPLVLRPKLDPRMWIWAARMLANCTASAYDRNKSRMVRLAEYSRDCLVEFRAATSIAYDERMQGTLQIFRDQKQFDHAASDIAVLARYGVPYQLLDAKGCVSAEPGLAAARVPLTGGLRLPKDETGDCRLFTERLAELCAARGVAFHYGVTIDALRAEGGRITGVATARGLFAADAYVLALGSYSPLMAKPIGISLPVFPIKGYSLTMAVENPALAPVSTVLDETFKVAITRLGSRIRVGGTAEIAGWDTKLRVSRRGPLDHSFGDLFPAAGDLRQATFWCGLRPMTPDGTPILGRAGHYGNLYLNTGHGTLGWTMAAGSGRILADLMSGRTPDIDTSDLGLNRS